MKIKLLFLPKYYTNVNDGTPTLGPGFPPLGIATLTDFLKEHNIFVKQDDLDIKVYNHNLSTNDPDKQINLKIFNDEKRIDEFIKNKHDPDLEEEGEKMLKMTKCKGFDVFGFSIYGVYEGRGVPLVLAKILKDRYDAKIVIGGCIPDSRIFLETDFIDYRIIGEVSSPGELNLLNFCRMLEKGVDEEKIPGLVYKKDRKIITNHMCYKKEKWSIFTKPCFDGLPMDLYNQRVQHEIDGKSYTAKILVLPYFFVKGCPYNCTFCMCSREPHWATKNPEEVALDLKELSKKYKTKYFFFANSNINPTYEYANQLADELIKNDVDVRWTDCAHFTNMDTYLLKKLKEAGAVRLIFGLESASPKMLRYINKNVKIKHAEKILREAHKLGIWSEIELICGFPYETNLDINFTLNFVRRNRKYLKALNICKFYLDGLLLDFPERYGIRLSKDVDVKIHPTVYSIPFEEINGLSWKQKIRQINRSYDEYIKTIFQELGFGYGMRAQELFFYRLHAREFSKS